MNELYKHWILVLVLLHSIFQWRCVFFTSYLRHIGILITSFLLFTACPLVMPLQSFIFWEFVSIRVTVQEIFVSFIFWLLQIMVLHVDSADSRTLRPIATVVTCASSVSLDGITWEPTKRTCMARMLVLLPVLFVHSFTKMLIVYANILLNFMWPGPSLQTRQNLFDVGIITGLGFWNLFGTCNTEVSELLLACGLFWSIVCVLVLHIYTYFGYNSASRLILKVHDAFYIRCDILQPLQW